MRIILIMGMALIVTLSQAEPLLLEGNLDGWRQANLKGKTAFDPIMDIEQGVILRAESVDAASLLKRNQTISMNKTPILRWQWTVEELPYTFALTEDGLEQKVRDFDEQSANADYAVRLIVGVNPVFGDERSIHYVWSAHYPAGTEWKADDNTHVMVVNGLGDTTMKWHTIARHVQKDWAEAFGESLDELDYVAIMTDSDEIRGHAIGYYGDIQAIAAKAIAAQ